MNADRIYREIEQEYDNRRMENQRILQQRMSEVSDRIPAYRELSEKSRRDGLRLLQRRLENDGSKPPGEEKVSFSAREIIQKKQELLVRGGYPKDYLDPLYSCRDCEDTGFLRDAYGARRIRCHCYRKRVTEKLGEAYGKASGLFDLIKTENFDNLSDRFYEGEDLANFRRAEQLCREFVSNNGEDYHNFLFYGNIGTGKSFLSVCMAAELLKQGKEVLYFSAVSFFEKLAALQFSEGYRSRDELTDFREEVYSCDMLILDDLGTERVNQFVLSELFSLVNERLKRAGSTVISTNLTLQNLSDTYTERVVSRITSGYTLCKLTGRDIRLEKLRIQNHGNTQ